MAWINLLECIYPVGAVYFSTVDISPASLIGGSWTKMTGGMLGLAGSEGVASAGSDGGSVKISVEQMPSHTHGFTTYFWRDSGTDFNSEQWLVAHTDNSSSPSSSSNSEFTTASTGGGQNFIPAHSSVYAWKRTA